MTPDSQYDSLPYLTHEVAPLRAVIKQRYEDFVVEELPLYPSSGRGTHCYFKIEKRGLATIRAVHDIARALGVPSGQIGVAGLKDARGVTVQTLSIEHVDPTRLQALDIPRIRVLSVERHTNKLKIGHLAANRFCIKLRDMDHARLSDMRAICQVLDARGVPNYFGSQRFGLRGDTALVGRAILERDFANAIDLILGRAGPHDHGDVLRARRLYDAGDYEAAANAWPYGFRDNVRACRAMAKSNGKHKRAFHAVDARMRQFFLNAFQSHIFNRVLARRIQEIDQVRVGDIAWKHENGATFLVEDAAAESPRATAFEISPTGPLFGPRMKAPQGEPAQVERSIMEDEGVTGESLGEIKGLRQQGARRPLRFHPAELEIEPGNDEHGPHVECRFTLPPGSYATVLLREVCKCGLEDSPGLDDPTS